MSQNDEKKCAKINLLELLKKLILFEFNSLCLLSNIEICKEIMRGEIQWQTVFLSSRCISILGCFNMESLISLSYQIKIKLSKKRIFLKIGFKFLWTLGFKDLNSAKSLLQYQNAKRFSYIFFYFAQLLNLLSKLYYPVLLAMLRCRECQVSILLKSLFYLLFDHNFYKK